MDTRTRIAEAAMAVLVATPDRRLGITVLNKALFYADLCALRDVGQTVTRSGYIALPQGPVLNHYERAIVRTLEALGWAEQTKDGMEKPMIVRSEPEGFSLLSKDEVGITQLVSRKIHHRTASWVSDYSHENKAWEIAFREKTGAPINLMLAMQQVLEDDPWMSKRDDSELIACLQSAEKDTGVPF